MFVIIPNWNQSSCVLPFKKKKLGRFAYADLKNLQNVFLSKKSKLRTIGHGTLKSFLQHHS